LLPLLFGPAAFGFPLRAGARFLAFFTDPPVLH